MGNGYRDHGHVPTDDQIAAEGFRAFPPRGEPLRGGSAREAELMARMGADAARGDVDELRVVALRLAQRMNPYWSWLSDEDFEPGSRWLI